MPSPLRHPLSPVLKQFRSNLAALRPLTRPFPMHIANFWLSPCPARSWQPHPRPTKRLTLVVRLVEGRHRLLVVGRGVEQLRLKDQLRVRDVRKGGTKQTAFWTFGRHHTHGPRDDRFVASLTGRSEHVRTAKSKVLVGCRYLSIFFENENQCRGDIGGGNS